MANGLSRRDMIKGAAAAGAAAWATPVIYGALSSPAGAATSCAGVKIASCSSVNGGSVAFCDFTTDSPADFSKCVSPDCSNYSPSTGFLLKLCGPAAANGRVVVKWASSAKDCIPDALNDKGCLETSLASGAGNDGSFSNCTNSSRASGYVYEWSAVGGAFSGNGGTITRPAVAGARWVLVWPPGSVNEIGVAVCFTFGSVPPTCTSC